MRLTSRPRETAVSNRSSIPLVPYEPTPETPGTSARSPTCTAAPASAQPARNCSATSRPARPAASIVSSTRPSSPPTPSEAIDSLRQTARTSSNIELLKVCWLNRILHGPDPLREKLTLFWHGHFATSNKKVESVALMDRQNETLRLKRPRQLRRAPRSHHRRSRHARLARRWNQQEGKAQRKLRPRVPRALHPGPRQLTPSATSAKPPGHSPAGSRQDARGSRETPSFIHDPAQVDDGAKTFLGQTGPWQAADIVRIVLDRPEAATFLAHKLYRFFVSEAGPPAAELIEPLAAEIKSHHFAIGPVVEIILRSRHFYSPQAYRSGSSRPSSTARGWSACSRSPALR